MSTAWERAMTFLEESEKVLDEEAAAPPRHRAPCWRCNRNPPRTPDKDDSCEACYAWMIGETDEDPKNPTRKDSRSGASMPPWFHRSEP